MEYFPKNPRNREEIHEGISGKIFERFSRGIVGEISGGISKEETERNSEEIYGESSELIHG